MGLVERLARMSDWWCGRTHLAETRRGMAAGLLVSAAALAVGLAEGRTVTRGIWSAKEPPRIPRDEPAGTRYGLSEATRHEIFLELAKAEPEARAHAEERFPADQPWRIEDDRSASERDAVRSLAAARAINISVVYLVLDEGIRARWTGPGGRALDPTTVPLHKRLR